MTPSPAPETPRSARAGGRLATLAAAPFTAAAAALAALALVLPLGTLADGAAVRWTQFGSPTVFAGCGLFAALSALLRPPEGATGTLAFALAGLATAAAPLLVLASPLPGLLDDRGWGSGFWCLVAALACLAVASLRRVAALGPAPGPAPGPTPGPTVPGRSTATRADRAGRATPVLFGAWVLVFWQIATRALEVPQVLLPAPSAVLGALARSWEVLAGDVVQTVLHSVLVGLALGAGAGFSTGIAIDRSPFLRRGLLPVAALAGTVPLVGVAPIMVMWFGFDWPSKAAVVALMTFFPMLVGTLAGLAESGRTERDLMRSYGAGYGRTLLALRLPVALPFVFAALKVDATLALIGAIVAEFFGSPTAGLGFRISTEAARLDMGLVWAAIVVASLAGSLLYGLVGWIERRVTFWHPSVRGTRA